MATARPRDELGATLRELLNCPMCSSSDPLATMLAGAMAQQRGKGKGLRVVAFRAKSIRLECRSCGLRFSVDPENLADVYADHKMPSPEVVEQQARERSAADPTTYLTNLMQMQDLARTFRARQRDVILGPHRRGVAAAQPRKRRIRFPKA